MEENRVILYTFNSNKGRPSITFLQGIPLLAENILTGIGSQKNKNFMQPWDYPGGDYPGGTTQGGLPRGDYPGGGLPSRFRVPAVT